MLIYARHHGVRIIPFFNFHFEWQKLEKVNMKKSRKRKELFRRWNKSIFKYFLRAFFWWNIKRADITFNVDVNLNLLQSKRVYGTQSNIYDGAFWEKIVNGFSIVDVPLGSKYVSVVFVFFPLLRHMQANMKSIVKIVDRF